MYRNTDNKLVRTAVMVLVLTMASMLVLAGSAGAYSIQGQIDTASEGDTIILNEGTFFENININKSISIIGNSTTIISQNGSLPVINVMADDVLIQAIYVDAYNLSTSGIYANQSQNLTIKDNYVTNASLTELPSSYYYY